MTLVGQGPIGVLRIAALPVVVLEQIPGPELVDALEASATARQRVDTSAADLIGACQEELGQVTPCHRSLLLDLARRGRRGLPLTASLRLRIDRAPDQLAPIAARATAYDEAWQAAGHVAGRLQQAAASADETLERQLAHHVDGDLGTGIALANPELHGLLVTEPAGAGKPPTSSKHRRARLTTAGRVLDRAVLRTTPFPGLAGIALVTMPVDRSGAPAVTDPSPCVRGYALAPDLSRQPPADSGLVQLSPLAERTAEGYLFPRWIEGVQEWVRIPPAGAQKVDQLLAAASITQRPVELTSIPAVHQDGAAFLRDAGLLIRVAAFGADGGRIDLRRRPVSPSSGGTVAAQVAVTGDRGTMIGDMVVDTDTPAAQGLARRAADAVGQAETFLFSLPVAPGAAAIRRAARQEVDRLGPMTLTRLVSRLLRQDELIDALRSPAEPPAWLGGDLGSALAQTGEAERRVEVDAFGSVNPAVSPTPFRSLAALVMELSGGSGRFVLNKVLPGGLRQVARYLDAWGDSTLVATGRHWIAARLGGRDPVQIQPVLRRNYQLTPLLAPRRLAVPGELVGSRADRLELDDVLACAASDGSLDLIDRRGGRAIGLFYAGCVREPSLPTPIRMLCALADSWPDEVADRYGAFYDLFDRARAATGGAGDYWRPRLVCGSLVLQRKRYVVRGSDLPRAAGIGVGDAGVTRFDRWRRDRGLPRRVFARALIAAPGRVRPSLFVDWTRPDILRSLSQGLGGRLHDLELVVLEEALPDLAGSRPQPGQHATEVLVEVGR